MSSLLSVKPTKVSLIKLKKSINVAKRVHKVLNNKRDVLLMRINKLIEEVSKLRVTVYEELLKAYDSITRAGMRIGPLRLERIAFTSPASLEVFVKWRSLMGIAIPSLMVVGGAEVMRMRYGFDETIALDEAILSMRKSIEAIIKLAEIENSIYKLAEELRKTQRLINALEKVIIPKYENLIKNIEMILEEREREEFIFKKMYKERMEKVGR